MREEIAKALQVITDYAGDATAPKSLQRGRTIELEMAESVIAYAQALRTASSIGLATILTRCGAYETLSPYLKTQWDRLSALHAMCDGAPAEPDGDPQGND